MVRECASRMMFFFWKIILKDYLKEVFSDIAYYSEHSDNFKAEIREKKLTIIRKLNMKIDLHRDFIMRKKFNSWKLFASIHKERDLMKKEIKKDTEETKKADENST